MASVNDGGCEMSYIKNRGWPWAAVGALILAAPTLANDIELERCESPLGTVAVVEP